MNCMSDPLQYNFHTLINRLNIIKVYCMYQLLIILTNLSFSFYSSIELQCGIFLINIGRYFKYIQNPQYHLLKTNSFIRINIPFVSIFLYNTFRFRARRCLESTYLTIWITRSFDLGTFVYLKIEYFKLNLIHLY